VGCAHHRYAHGLVGTDKRERQKANRSQKQVQEQRLQRRRSVQRRVLRLATVLIVGVLGVVVIAWIAGAFDSDAPDQAPIGADTTDGGRNIAPATTDPAIVEPTECPPADGGEVRREFPAAPPMCLDPDVDYSAELTTNFGPITIELDQQAAPLAVNNFVVLARYGYYDNTVCHRIIGDFVIQCGDPTATGSGGPGYAFADELPDPGQYRVGSVAMANSGPDTNGSQFFIITGAQGEALPPAYSLFGGVTAGLDTVEAIDAVANPANDLEPLEEVRIARVRIVES